MYRLFVFAAVLALPSPHLARAEELAALNSQEAVASAPDSAP